MRKLILAATASTLLFTQVALAQECSLILNQGIYDISNVESDERSASSFSHWFCDQKFSSAESSNNFGGAIGFPFKGLPVKLGFDSSSHEWSEWYSKFCSSTQSTQSQSASLKQHIKTASPAILNAFNSCISSAGLHVWLERTYKSSEFFFAARYIPYNENNPTARFDLIDIGDNVRCTSLPRNVSTPTQRSRCTRLDDEAVSIVVNASVEPAGGNKLQLPAIKRFREVIILNQAPNRLFLEDVDCAIKTGDSVCSTWVNWATPPQGQQAIVRVGDNDEGYFACGGMEPSMNRKLAPFITTGKPTKFRYYLVVAAGPAHGCTDQIPSGAPVAESSIAVRK